VSFSAAPHLEVRAKKSPATVAPQAPIRAFDLARPKVHKYHMSGTELLGRILAKRTNFGIPNKIKAPPVSAMRLSATVVIAPPGRLNARSAQTITLQPLFRRQYGAGGIHAAEGLVTA
jgi:hypothetical protein